MSQKQNIANFYIFKVGTYFSKSKFADPYTARILVEAWCDDIKYFFSYLLVSKTLSVVTTHKN